jgi:hypothetical protein
LLGGAPVARGSDLAEQLAQAPALKVENVCVPIRDTRGGERLWFLNADGRSWDLVVRYFEGYIQNTFFTIIDFGTGEVKQQMMEKGSHSISLAGPDGKGYGHGLGGLMVYDPASNALARLPGSPYVGGETRPLLAGPDGMIYGAGSEGGRVTAYRVDPATGGITNFGLLGPTHDPNPCWSYSMAADDRFLYIVSGKIPWYLVVYDRTNGTDEVVLTHADPEGIVMLGSAGGCPVATVRHSDGKPEESYWLVQGKPVLRKSANEAPPIAAKTAATPALPPKPSFDNDLMPLNGKVSLAYTLPGETTPRQIEFPVPTYPANVYQIASLPDGRIVGSSGHYLGLFCYDPKTDRTEHFGKLSISVPVMAWLDGRLYLSGYPRGATMAYDPASAWGKSNPAFLGSLGNEGSGIHTTYAIVAAADGRIYLGGGWYRNGEGGGLGWWDPKEKKAGGLSAGLERYRVTHLTTTGAGRYVVLSTKAVRDQAGNRPAPDQARIFVYDTTTRAMIKDFETLRGAIHTGAIAGADGTRVLALAPDPEDASTNWSQRASVLYAFDALTGEVAWRKKLPYPAGFVINDNYDNTVGFDFRLGPDGHVWTFSGGQMRVIDPEKAWGLACEDASLIRIKPEDGSITVVGKIGTVGRMAFSGKDLYLTGGSKYHKTGAEYLRRVKEVVK